MIYTAHPNRAVDAGVRAPPLLLVSIQVRSKRRDAAFVIPAPEDDGIDFLLFEKLLTARSTRDDLKILGQ